MPDIAIIADAWRKSILIGTAILALSGPTAGQDRMVLGPRQFEPDRSGAGAVLCAWTIYLTVRAQAAACGLARQPVDDAIDEAIAAMDEFILANSSPRPTRAALDDLKRGATPQLDMTHPGNRQKICGNRDFEPLRSTSPDQIRASTRAFLAVPREPVMNPCL